MEYNPESASTDQRLEFLKWLTDQTVTALRNSVGNPTAIQTAITTFVQHAIAAHMSIEDIENMLGINEPSIMDLAQLSEADEEIVIDAFELYVNNEPQRH
jgi:hypothetical protein